jgi:hypothetical protein
MRLLAQAIAVLDAKYLAAPIVASLGFAAR